MLDAFTLPYRGRPQVKAEPGRSNSMHTSMAPTKTTPIQIPQRRRPITVAGALPYAQPISPDMIFEMSPVTSDFPTNHTSFSLGRRNANNDSFVYSVPHFSTPKRRSSSKSRMSDSPSSSPRARGISHGSSDVPTIKHPISRGGQCVLDDLDLSPDTPTREANTTRVTGFLPIKGDLHDQFQDQNRPLQRLSPGPRRASYNSSPWILPGKGEGSDEDLASSQADVSPFEFERQLLRRIENQNRPRFAGLRSYCM